MSQTAAARRPALCRCARLASTPTSAFAPTSAFVATSENRPWRRRAAAALPAMPALAALMRPPRSPRFFSSSSSSSPSGEEEERNKTKQSGQNPPPPPLSALVTRFFAAVHPDRLAGAGKAPQSAARNAESLGAMNEVVVALRALPRAAGEPFETFVHAGGDAGSDRGGQPDMASEKDLVRALRALPESLAVDFDVLISEQMSTEGGSEEEQKEAFATTTTAVGQGGGSIRTIRASVPLRAPRQLVERQLRGLRERRFRARQRRSAGALPLDDRASEQADVARVHLQFASCALELTLYRVLPGCGAKLTPPMEARVRSLEVLVDGDDASAVDGEAGEEFSARAEMNRARVDREIASLMDSPDPDSELRGLIQLHLSSLQKDRTYMEKEGASLHTTVGDLHDSRDNVTSRKRLQFRTDRIPASVSRHTVDSWLSPFDVNLVFVEDPVPAHVRAMAQDAIFRHGRELHRRACANLPLAPIDAAPRSKVERVMDAEADEIASARNHDWSGVSILLAADDADFHDGAGGGGGGFSTLSLPLTTPGAAAERRAELQRSGWVVVPASTLAKVNAGLEFDGGSKGRAFNAAADFAAAALGRHMSRAQGYRTARRTALRRCATLQQLLQRDVLKCRAVVLGGDDLGLAGEGRDALDPFDAERLLGEMALDPGFASELQKAAGKRWRKLELRIVGPAAADQPPSMPAFVAPSGKAVCIVAAADPVSPGERSRALQAVRAELSQPRTGGVW
jgi:hypothetical protein